MFLACKHRHPGDDPHRGNGGAIVNVSSISALRPRGLTAYMPVSKGAVIALTKAIAVDHGADGIRANCVAPGPVYTPNGLFSWHDRTEHRGHPPSGLRAQARGHPAGISAALCASCCRSRPDTSLARYCVVDGGATLVGPEPGIAVIDDYPPPGWCGRVGLSRRVSVVASERWARSWSQGCALFYENVGIGLEPARVVQSANSRSPGRGLGERPDLHVKRCATASPQKTCGRCRYRCPLSADIALWYALEDAEPGAGDAGRQGHAPHRSGVGSRGNGSAQSEDGFSPRFRNGLRHKGNRLFWGRTRLALPPG